MRTITVARYIVPSETPAGRWIKSVIPMTAEAGMMMSACRSSVRRESPMGLVKYAWWATVAIGIVPALIPWRRWYVLSLIYGALIWALMALAMRQLELENADGPLFGIGIWGGSILYPMAITGAIRFAVDAWRSPFVTRLRQTRVMVSGWRIW